jgi:hypothetical protein
MDDLSTLRGKWRQVRFDSMGDDAGKALPASYELDEGSFIFIAADEGMPRPTIFVTSPGMTLRGFVRHHPA